MPSPSRYYSSNAAKTTLADSISSSATSLTLSAASNLPAQYPYTLILEKDTANEEVIEVTSLVGSSYQITRNIDSSGAKAHAVGANVEHGVSARDFTESRSHEIATTSAHGVSGDVVGTSGAQTLASKTLTTPTINGATISGTFTSTATISGGTITGAIITGLATPTASSSAATKGYIDTSVTSAAASATAAATSASSASTSASSAVTSASSASTSAASAATSATAAATSAASASTSATSAQTYASTMATSVTSAATSATSAATSASSALTSQTAAATSETNAAASATAAATSATSAATSASSASTQATAATTSATSAATSASSALTSATSAAASATAATTSASSASTSASSALTSQTAAATSATSAATSASSAATSATSAQTFASTMATSVSSAQTSATSAAASATAAAASYDSFDDRYLGAYSTAPALDNDGNAITTGALYWNSVSSTMFAWTGSAWGSISSTAAIYRYKFVAVGGETSVSGTDALSQTLTYLPGKEQVYLNGVLLVRTTDYTASNGSSITGLTALAASDILEIITFTAFSLVTAIENTTIDAKGDLLVGTAADTVGRLAVGVDGYVLKANSGTGTGLEWAAQTDQTPVTTKGDLFTFSTVDARLAVGNNGETLVADSSTATGLGYQGNFAAGKNKIINGDFYWNQRNFTNTTTTLTYGFDRFQLSASNGTNTYSAETFTTGAAPVAGYEAKNYARLVSTGQTLTNANTRLNQNIENVRTFAGQTVTVSFWAQSGSGTPSVAVELQQNFGTGGSPSAAVNTIISSPAKQAISTSWARYSFTISVPSISGKTIGTNEGTSFVVVSIWVSAGTDFNARTGSLGIQSNTFNFWGLQVEAGSVATSFQTATGTLQGELAACQRYFQRIVNGAEQQAENIGVFQCRGASTGIGSIAFLTPMRVAPTLSVSSAGHFFRFDSTGGSLQALTALSFIQTSPRRTRVDLTWTSGTTAGDATDLIIDNASGTLDASAEL